MLSLVEIETISRFENTDHFAGYIGLRPNRSDSGETKKVGEMTHRGQPLLKKCLIEASWMAARFDPALSLAYNKYTQRMEPNKELFALQEN